MHYPALIIDLEKVRHNTRVLVDKCREHHIDVAAVTKVFCAIPKVAEAMVEGGAYMLADSRILNLRKMKNIDIPKMLLRIPMKSQAEEVVELADISLNSEYDTLVALSQAAEEKEKVHKVILMTDLGDLREGVWKDELVEYVGKLLELKGIRVIGLGTNLTCYGGVIPKSENIGQLVEMAEEINKRYGLQLEIISGGNSSSLHLLDKGEMPKGVNQLRLGESIVLGFETAFGERIPDTHRDAFTFAAEIIEIKEKPSVPVGEIGMDAFGEKPVFEDRGIIKRAILGVGRHDVRTEGLIPKDQKISMLGASSDHLIMDVTNSDREYKVGDILEFNLTYGGLMSLSASEYVDKVLL